MSTGILISITICVIFMIGAYSCRGKQVMKNELSPVAAFCIILVAVIVSAFILYALVMRTPSLPQPAEGMGAGEDLMGMARGMGRESRPPSPSRDLRQLVQKMALFVGKDSGGFSAEQGQVLVPLLEGLRVPERFTDETAALVRTEIENALTEQQLTDLNALELPRRGRGGSRGRVEGATGETAPPPEASAEGASPAAPAAPPEDRRATFRERMLALPAVKTAYDAKVAEDPAFAEDSEAQRGFFRTIMREINPFHMGRGQEALDALLARLSPAGGTPQPAAE